MTMIMVLTTAVAEVTASSAPPPPSPREDSLEDLIRSQFMRHYLRGVQDNRSPQYMAHEFPEGFLVSTDSRLGNPRPHVVRIPALEDKEIFISTMSSEGYRMGKRFIQVKESLPEALGIQFEKTVIEMTKRAFISIDKAVIQSLIEIHDLGTSEQVIEYIEAVKTVSSHPWVHENAFIWTRPVYLHSSPQLKNHFDRDAYSPCYP